jgi:hypothetical protein
MKFNCMYTLCTVEIMKHECQTCHTHILAEEDDSLFPTGSYLIKQVQYVCNNWEYFTHLFQLMSVAI